MYMCKFRSIFFCNYISVCPCTEQSEIVPGQSGLNEKRQDIANFIS